MTSGRAEPGQRYCLITPCRDEAAFIRRTLQTVAEQSIQPTRWIIVDDGSQDSTPAILDEFAQRHPFIQVVRRDDRGERAVGPGVVDAFYAGLERVDLDDYDYICKLDGDLDLPPRYFERAMQRMSADPHLGNFSGKLFERLSDGRLIEERTGDENAVGPAKFYRVECFRDIGGFVPEVAWDGIDGHVCRMNGWVALSEDDPEMRIVHLRPMGSSQQNIWVGRQRWGRGKYYMGSAWYYVAAAACYRMAERPWIVGGLGISLGYLRAALRAHPRHPDDAYRRFLRRYELESLVLGKRRTLTRYNRRIRENFPRQAPAERPFGSSGRGRLAAGRSPG